MSETETFSLDTHAMVKDFVAAGFTEKQAEVHVTTLARFIRYNIATKTDVAEIQRDIAEVKREIAGMQQETGDVKREVAGVQQEIVEVKRDIAELKKDVALLSRDLTIRLGGIMAVGIGIVVALAAFAMTRTPL